MPQFFVHEDISVAETLDTAFYLQPDLFEQAKTKIFSNSLHFINDETVVANSNDCFPFTLLPGVLDVPLVLTKDSNGIIYCLSNVCTHRGNILVNEPCNQSNLRCRYHGRIFGNDGTFKIMPEFKEVRNFPRPEDHLAQLPLVRWGKWLFTALNHTAVQDKFLTDMMRRIEWMPVEEFVFKPELSQTFTVNAHWALYCENYLEGFHIPFVHAGLNTVIDFGSYTTELYTRSNLQLGIAKKGEHCFDIPASSPDFGKQVAAYYFFVFPNMMFNFYPWGLSLNIIEPVSTMQTNVKFLNYVWKDELLGQGAGAALETVELEDEEVVEAVQQGIRSPYYKHGRYSVTREQGTHHFHRLICEFMK